jgi:superfamily II DNA or RNA helicase
MSTPELRPYQRDAIDEVRDAIAAGHRRIILVAPTGSGKTIIGADLIETATRAGKRVLVLAHRREIIQQTAAKLAQCAIFPGIVMADVKSRPREPVQVASIQTLWMRAKQRKISLPPADLLVVDECHHAPAMTYTKIIDNYPDAVLLGLTATPCRGDGRGLGSIFDTMVECPQVPDLIKLGFLVPTRTYAPVDPDLKGVRTRHGDFVESELAERMDRQELVGDIITHWHKYGERRKSVAFAVNVAHSIHIRDEFIRSGVRCEHIDGATPKLERDATLARLASGEIEVVSNCMVLTEGWDMPEAGCCILARPTKKMGLYRQMIGRVLRPAEGKPNAIVLDHSGAVFRHGFVEDPVAWTLDPDRHAENRTHSAREREHGSRLLECTACGSVRVAGEPCSYCGFLPQRPPRGVSFQDGDLALVDGSRRPKGNVYSPEERERWHGMLIWIANERDYKPGWVAHKYKEKFGTWPPWGAPQPIAPTDECRSWVRSRMIAYARRRVA